MHEAHHDTEVVRRCEGRATARTSQKQFVLVAWDGNRARETCRNSCAGGEYVEHCPAGVSARRHFSSQQWRNAASLGVRSREVYLKGYMPSAAAAEPGRGARRASEIFKPSGFASDAVRPRG